ncbi:MAG: two-component system response regulator [Deltaproteobacteria bacterium HGW-Deltaproteobacteria-18]|jgi:DNA-binding response OmpR family regulator|nr:MAG: two-component system response regulator [Deltaproteobacteria bacterium HGW-Deltaproteobacteria-18]
MSNFNRVLIVDDEAQIRSSFIAYCEDYDEFEILVAASAEEGLSILERDGADLCIVDMRLPGMHGGDFIRAASGRCRRFLIHTGSVDTELSAELESLGMSSRDVLLKPCSMSRMIERIRHHLALP